MNDRTGEYVYHKDGDMLGLILKNRFGFDGIEWFLIQWSDNQLQWMGDYKDFIRDDIVFIASLPKQDQIALILRLLP